VKRRDLLIGLAAVPLAGGCAARAPSWVRRSTGRYTREVTLPPPVLGGPPLDEVLHARRSIRSYRAEPLPVATLGRLLWAGQGLTSSDGKRTAPSAGMIYPLELYVVTPQELMHYLPHAHSVQVRDVADLRPGLVEAAGGQAELGSAPAVLVLAAVPARTQRKYGARGTSFVDREAGHAAQNILLQATALGLGAVPIGSIDPSRAAVVLGLPPGQLVLYAIPVGHVDPGAA
jgi:SagB-type dehydrogenase family enzyme